MKRLITLKIAALTVVALSGFASYAAPVRTAHVAADAKWLLHLDLTQFRQSQIGGHLSTNFLDKELAKAQAGLQQAINIKLPLDAIASLTAYGLDFNPGPQTKGVLLVSLNLKTNPVVLLDAAVAALSLMNPEAESPFKRLTNSATPLYAVQKELFIAVPSQDILVLGKSQEQIVEACDVMKGKAPNLAGSKSFSDFPKAPEGFIFLAVAEGFAANAAIPPQARVLQMADGARIVLGEKGDNLFLNLALKAKTAENATQMQQVFQGMLALLTLSQMENQELMQLAQGIKVTGTDRLVSVGFEHPVAKILDHIKAKHPGFNLGFDDDEGDVKPPKKLKKKKSATAAAEETTQEEPAKTEVKEAK